MQIPVVHAHNHSRPDGIYHFDARGIAKRFRHGDRAGRSRGPFGDATPERDAGASVTVTDILSAGRTPSGGPSANTPRRPIFGLLDALNPGERMRFVNDHDPLPLLQQMRERYGESVDIQFGAEDTVTREHVLILLTAVTLALLLTGVALPRLTVAPPAFWAHLVLAVGVMSLITAAMQHFVPVLCRGRGAGRWMGRLPWLMFSAGLLTAAVLMGWLEWGWIVPAALLALTGAASMIRWMVAAARAALGGPHPCLAWYVAAMACLAAGLTAAALIPLMPGWHGVLRAFHAHINLYGFVALTAVGTLQVLMPTVANRPDPEAGRRLKRDLKWVLTGSVLLAAGQTTDLVWLATVGAALWGWVLVRMLRAWIRHYGKHLFALHGNAPPLFAASLGLAAAMLGSLGLGRRPGRSASFCPVS